MSHQFDPTILREYDIRGILDETLGAEDARAIGRSFGTMLRRAGGSKVAVGYDGRTSSPMLEEALVDGLLKSGCDAVRVGMGATPMLYFAAASAEDVDGGIQITGSHNPANYNGFKMVFQSRPFFGDDIVALGEMAARGDWLGDEGTAESASTNGVHTSGANTSGASNSGASTSGKGASGEGASAEIRPVFDAYIDALLRPIEALLAEGSLSVDGGAQGNRNMGGDRNGDGDGNGGHCSNHAALSKLKIGWDAGNGAAGPAIEALTARLPGEHHLLFTEVDGTFPNHHPDPTVEDNLADLRALVAQKKLDFGVAFDGDGDRIGAIDGEGRVIWGDQLLMIYAEDLLRRQPGATIIADVKASRALFDHVTAHGGQPIMWKTGHSLIKSKMKETGAPLAGEMSGHVFFADEYYGYDDALYAAMRLMTGSLRLGRSVTQLRGDMPQMVNTPELRFQVDESRKFAAIDEVKARLAEIDADAQSGVKVDSTDGVRVSSEDGWWLLRASNTQDVLVARAESDSEAGLARLMAQIDAQLSLSGLERGENAGH